MVNHARLDPGDRSASAARSVHALNRASIGSEENHTVTVPGSAAAGAGIAEGRRWTAAGRHDFQFSIGGESERAAIRRPERMPGIVRV